MRAWLLAEVCARAFKRLFRRFSRSMANRCNSRGTAASLHASVLAHVLNCATGSSSHAEMLWTYQVVPTILLLFGHRSLSSAEQTNLRTYAQPVLGHIVLRLCRMLHVVFDPSYGLSPHMAGAAGVLGDVPVDATARERRDYAGGRTDNVDESGRQQFAAPAAAGEHSTILDRLVRAPVGFSVTPGELAGCDARPRVKHSVWMLEYARAQALAALSRQHRAATYPATVLHAAPLAYWRLNDVKNTSLARNLGVSGLRASAVYRGKPELEVPCGVVNDNARFQHSSCMRLSKGASHRVASHLVAGGGVVVHWCTRFLHGRHSGLLKRAKQSIAATRANGPNLQLLCGGVGVPRGRLSRHSSHDSRGRAVCSGRWSRRKVAVCRTVFGGQETGCW